MKAKIKAEIIDSKDVFFMPGIEAMVRDGVYPDVETAIRRITFQLKKHKPVVIKS